MALTKKDYQFFAALNKGFISNSNSWVEDGVADIIVQQGRHFWQDNPRFDPRKFLEASGVPEIYFEGMIHRMGVWK